MTAFRQVQALSVFQGLPLQHTFLFDEPDDCGYILPLSLTGRTVTAQLRGRPKAKVMQVNVVDPPTPGVYEFQIVLGGVAYPFEFELEAGESAQDWVKKFKAALNALALDLSLCAETCGAEGEIIVAGIWPGQVWTLVLVDAPDPTEVEIEEIQPPDVLLATFTVTTGTNDAGTKTTVRISLTGTQTSGLPMAGSGPLNYRVLATDNVDPNDVLFLARGHLLVGFT